LNLVRIGGGNETGKGKIASGKCFEENGGNWMWGKEYLGMRSDEDGKVAV
jgi:hypothetical protein